MRTAPEVELSMRGDRVMMMFGVREADVDGDQRRRRLEERICLMKNYAFV